MSYKGNSRCTCARCRMSGIMGPVVLITLGVLFLLQSYSHGFQWPILLIVIGLVKILQYSASTEGHVQAGYVSPAGPITPPPPAASAGNLPPAPAPYNPDTQGYEENRNG